MPRPAWTIEEWDARWADVRRIPRGEPRVTQVCVRPGPDTRGFPEILQLDRDRGAIGDRWEHRTWMYLPDGRPDPRVQVAIADQRLIAFVQERTACARHPGDTLLVDADLSEAALPTGTRLAVGSAELEVSDVENDACAKFALHHGADVLAWIRAPHNHAFRLRGLFARVLRSGEVRNGDPIRRL